MIKVREFEKFPKKSIGKRSSENHNFYLLQVDDQKHHIIKIHGLKGHFTYENSKHNYFLQKVELSIGENCYCWPLKRVWKKVVSQGKVSEKSGNLDMDIEWQPC